jgi:hypothetical protein
MTGTAERIAVTAWRTHCAVADEGRGDWGEFSDLAAWGPELTEVIDGAVVGDCWSGRDWPTGTAQGFLADFHAHRRATHLVLVATGTGYYADHAPIRVRTLHVVGADGEAFGLIAPLDDPSAEPLALPAVSGDLYAAMVEALTPDHEYEDELADLLRGGGAS